MLYFICAGGTVVILTFSLDLILCFLHFKYSIFTCSNNKASISADILWSVGKTHVYHCCLGFDSKCEEILKWVQEVYLSISTVTLVGTHYRCPWWHILTRYSWKSIQTFYHIVHAFLHKIKVHLLLQPQLGMGWVFMSVSLLLWGLT